MYLDSRRSTSQWTTFQEIDGFPKSGSTTTLADQYTQKAQSNPTRTINREARLQQ
jgi:hypothetical protein